MMTLFMVVDISNGFLLGIRNANWWKLMLIPYLANGFLKVANWYAILIHSSVSFDIPIMIYYFSRLTVYICLV